jgi:glucan phosphoethanolaminetransferase (alkaline phosphatase superfamily)
VTSLRPRVRRVQVDRARRARRIAAALALLGPSIWMVGGDLVRRARWILAFDRLHAAGYAASIAGAALFWATILYVASARRPPPRAGPVAAVDLGIRWAGGAIFLALFVVAAAVEAAFHGLYNLYYAIDGGYFVDSTPWMILGTLPLTGWVVLHFAVAAGAGVGILLSCRKALRPRRRRMRWLAPLFLILIAVTLRYGAEIPVSYQGLQSTTPELIYFHGVVWVLGDRIRRAREHDPNLVRIQGRRAGAEPLSALAAAPARPRNVLVVLEEAQRADVTCVAFDPACAEATPATNALLPGRLPLTNVRSNASSTFVSVTALFSGLDPTETEARLSAAPLIWDLAHAAGYDTAFWSGQFPTFNSYRLFFQDLPLSHRAMGGELDPTADWLAGPPDEALSARVEGEIDALAEPFFAVVQYSNIHYPRLFDPARAPFQPSDPAGDFEAARNHYKNVVYLSDLAVAHLLAHVRGAARGPRTVIVYTSDHGEALGEHDNENYHSGSVHEEEIRIPAWIDAPAGTLSPAEEQSLRDKRAAPLFQLDLFATIVDLIGLWDAPALGPLRDRWIGRPATRPERATRPVPLSNVSWFWEYWRPNWGLMDYPRKILALPEDDAYRCYDVLADPGEEDDLGEVGCRALVEQANDVFHVLPRDMKRHLHGEPRWGRQP